MFFASTIWCRPFSEHDKLLRGFCDDLAAAFSHNDNVLYPDAEFSRKVDARFRAYNCSCGHRCGAQGIGVRSLMYIEPETVAVAVPEIFAVTCIGYHLSGSGVYLTSGDSCG